MKRPLVFLLIVAFLASVFPHTVFAEGSTNRRDGFLLIWRSTSRPAESTREKPYVDVPKGDSGFSEITYAKARGLLSDEQEYFYPDDPLTPSDALRWIFRTRSVEPIDANGDTVFMGIVEPADVPLLAERYGISYNAEASTMTREELLTLMRLVDEKLQSEVHEVSFYSEKFHGKGTAFGETFDMYALTAAHRSFPVNTLVKVTNVGNGKSVLVRINDRGPFVQGRDMDLSLGAFLSIAERSLGKINATFERLGDAGIVHRCSDDRLQRRITRAVILHPGIPHSFPRARTLSLTSESPFVILTVTYPDGNRSEMQTWLTKGETYEFTPSILGTYVFRLGTGFGRSRTMTMNVVECEG